MNLREHVLRVFKMKNIIVLIVLGLGGVFLQNGFVYKQADAIEYFNPENTVKNRVQPYTENPMYWQYKGKPVLLLGASSNDNLFQQTFSELDDELKKLADHGGNYLRCTMSGRDEGDDYPFHRDDITGLFDLNKWSNNYWQKFEYFLQSTQKKEIIVQIEIWATYDFYNRHEGWGQNPFNPKMNSSYTAEESKLPNEINYPAQTKNNPFFCSVPKLDNNHVVLPFQKKFVDKLLSIALKYPNVLYCIDNETKVRPEWGEFWSAYIRKIADGKGLNIYVTEMWDNWDPTEGLVGGAVDQHPELGEWYTQFMNPAMNQWAKPSNTINNPGSYQFIDISNNNTQRGEVHYNTMLFVRNNVLFSGLPRPVNNVKIYGGEEKGWNGNDKDGQERFWRNIFAGAASVRFHRPTSGLGNSHIALAHVKTMRMLTDEIDFFKHKPANHLLEKREENEAYCIAKDQEEYVIWFTGKGEVNLNMFSGKYRIVKNEKNQKHLYELSTLDVPKREYEIKWLNVLTSKWTETQVMKMPGLLKTPSDEQWAVIIRSVN